MATRYDLEQLPRRYREEAAWAKLEALYTRVKCIDGYQNACRNIRLRYGNEDPCEAVKGDLGQLLGAKPHLWDKTEDTGDRYKDMLAQACEECFPEELTERVGDQLPSLSQEARRLAFLFLREGSILSGEVASRDGGILSLFTPAHKVIFGEPPQKETLDELIKVGLIYLESWSTSRRRYYEYCFVPPFSRSLWPILPEVIPLPEIAVEAEAIKIREEQIRWVAPPRPPAEHGIYDIAFRGRGLEGLVLEWVRRDPQFTRHCQKVEESLHDIEFDVWVEKGDKYVVFECKGPETTADIELRDLRDFWARVMDLQERSKREVEAWVVNTGVFTGDQESYIREKGMRRLERPELLRKLLYWEVLGLDLKGMPKFTTDKGIFFSRGAVSAKSEQIFVVR